MRHDHATHRGDYPTNEWWRQAIVRFAIWPRGSVEPPVNRSRRGASGPTPLPPGKGPAVHRRARGRPRAGRRSAAWPWNDHRSQPSGATVGWSGRLPGWPRTGRVAGRLRAGRRGTWRAFTRTEPRDRPPLPPSVDVCGRSGRPINLAAAAQLPVGGVQGSRGCPLCPLHVPFRAST